MVIHGYRMNIEWLMMVNVDGIRHGKDGGTGEKYGKAEIHDTSGKLFIGYIHKMGNN